MTAYYCPRCGSQDLEVLGHLRRTIYRCRDCGHQFTHHRKDV